MSYKPFKSKKLSLGVSRRSSPRILFPTEIERVESRFSAVQSMILATCSDVLHLLGRDE